MPITHYWDDLEKSLYLVKAEGSDWSWVELIDIIREIYRTLAEADHKLNLGLWFADKLPEGNILAQMRVIGGSQPPTIRHTVFINQSGKLLEMLITSFDRANNWEGPGFVDSLEEAREYLAQKD
jgi:hypothetical protein